LDTERTLDDMAEAAATIDKLLGKPFKDQELYVAVIRANINRANLMPTQYDALAIMCQAHERLRDLGWREGMYAPKDGTTFETVQAGSTGVHDCYYSPDGYWNFIDNDVYPSKSAPLLYRLKPNKSALTKAECEGK
jgi:hypothetical protein